jgi:hypothetical protein
VPTAVSLQQQLMQLQDDPDRQLRDLESPHPGLEPAVELRPTWPGGRPSPISFPWIWLTLAVLLKELCVAKVPVTYRRFDQPGQALEQLRLPLEEAVVEMSNSCRLEQRKSSSYVLSLEPAWFPLR